MKIEGAVAFVTGTNRGLGEQLIKALKAKGAAKIYAASRMGETSEEGTIPVKLDITHADEIVQAAVLAQDTTLLINNAGLNHESPLLNPLQDDYARFEMEVNYFGPLAMCRAFAPILGANGGGTLVNILTIAGLVNIPMMGSLSASKAAAFSLTQGVRAQLAKQGTLVIGVMPGALDTDMAKNAPPPKLDPAEAAHIILAAVENGLEDVYPGDMAQGIAQGLATDWKRIEKEFAFYLPA